MFDSLEIHTRICRAIYGSVETFEVYKARGFLEGEHYRNDAIFAFNVDKPGNKILLYREDTGIYWREGNAEEEKRVRNFGKGKGSEPSHIPTPEPSTDGTFIVV